MKLLAKISLANFDRRDFSNGCSAGLEAGCFEIDNNKLGILDRSVEVGMQRKRPPICLRIVGKVLVGAEGRMDESCA